MKKLIKRIVACLLILAIAPIIFTYAAGIVTGRAKTVGSVISTALTEEEKETEEEGSEALAEVKNETYLITWIEDKGNSADIIMLVNLERGAKSNISILQIPGDTYINSEKYDFHKISGIYTDAYNRCKKDGGSTTDAIKKGNGELCAFIEKEFDVDIDCYFSVGSRGFEKIIDSIGGVDITLSSELDYDGVHFSAGKNHLDGKAAEKFIRCADHGSIDVQKILLCAMANKIKSGLGISKTVALSKELYSNVTTNMPMSKMVSLIPSLFKTDVDNMNFEKVISNSEN